MTVHIFISGFVQGVGFRQFVKREAVKAGATGWVRNMPDGRVEAKLYGPKAKIEGMIAVYRKGPFLSEVQDVVVVWEDKETLLRPPEDFRIVK